MIKVALSLRKKGKPHPSDLGVVTLMDWEKVMEAFSVLDMNNRDAVVDFLRRYINVFSADCSEKSLNAVAAGFMREMDDDRPIMGHLVPIKGEGNTLSAPLNKVIQEISDYMADDFYEELRPEVEAVEGRMYALKVFMDLPFEAGNEAVLRQILVGPWPPACIKVEGTGSDRIKNLKAAITVAISSDKTKHLQEEL